MVENNIIEVKNLKKHFEVGYKRVLKAVDDVSFSIKQGETLGIVGESGCGKTTCGRTSIGLYHKTGGTVLYRGQDVHRMSGKQRKELSKKVQMIFQDPYACLDPRMKVQDIVAEALRIQHLVSGKKEERERVLELLEMVGLHKEHANRYIHEFSGGQRQRIGIARALAVEPEFIVCDEPISSLDVSIQAQVVNLLSKLQQEKKLTYLFISHDLSMVKYISNNVGVMYLGTMVEITSAKQLYANAAHPYTQALLSAIPIPDPKAEQSRHRIAINGEIPSPINLPRGCHYNTRCPYAKARCREERPILVEIEKDHFVACHLFH